MEKKNTAARSEPSDKPYVPPKGSSGELRIGLGKQKSLDVKFEADWIVLRKKEKAVAEIFHVYYHLAKSKVPRPTTFVFNGGPGAASAYLHVGALGPRRVTFEPSGALPKPPARLSDNVETWLTFTDLVFVDPVGTGFSRTIDEKPEPPAKESGGEKPEKENREFYGINRDLDAMCEFISKFLSKHHRWGNPCFIAGESYGGFRVARLCQKLQEGVGVGLNGAILISPALELTLLSGSDYDTLQWADVFPTMAAAAHFHGKSRKFGKEQKIEKVLAEAERFAAESLIPWLSHPGIFPIEKRAKLIKEMADFTGLPPEFIDLRNGRISLESFSRELLRAERKICGLYDASVTATDPFPDRNPYSGPDPTLGGIEYAFTGAINHHLRSGLGLETERDYHLLNFDVNTHWKIDEKRHAFETQLGATDALRFGMALNPHLKVWITHGFFDTVTPYFSSNRIAGLMKLSPDMQGRLSLKHFPGGHMFYTWQNSRQEFRNYAENFYRSCL